MKKRYALLGGVSLAILIAASGCSGKKMKMRGPDTIQVKVIRLDPVSNEGSQIVYNGTLQANKTIDLSFQVSGTIKSFPFQVGDFVKKGALIAAVDETTYLNQYNAQLAQAKLAQENYKRTLAVFEKGSIAEIKMLEARANYEQATSAAKAIYQNIAHTKLYAPQDGYIGEKGTEAGSIANPGQPVLTLLDTRSVDVLVAVPENEVNNYKAGDQATVMIDALGNRSLTGRVTEIGVLALNNSANYNLKIKLENSGRELRPGMLCKVQFTGASSRANNEKAGEVLIPLQAVQVDEHGKNFVYVAGPDNKAERRAVQTGALYPNSMAITSGLKGNEQVITSGFQKIGDQSPIKIQE